MSHRHHLHINNHHHHHHRHGVGFVGGLAAAAVGAAVGAAAVSAMSGSRSQQRIITTTPVTVYAPQYVAGPCPTCHGVNQQHLRAEIQALDSEIAQRQRQEQHLALCIPALMEGIEHVLIDTSPPSCTTLAECFASLQYTPAAIVAQHAQLVQERRAEYDTTHTKIYPCGPLLLLFKCVKTSGGLFSANTAKISVYELHPYGTPTMLGTPEAKEMFAAVAAAPSTFMPLPTPAMQQSRVTRCNLCHDAPFASLHEHVDQRLVALYRQDQHMQGIAEHMHLLNHIAVITLRQRTHTLSTLRDCFALLDPTLVPAPVVAAHAALVRSTDDYDNRMKHYEDPERRCTYVFACHKESHLFAEDVAYIEVFCVTPATGAVGVGASVGVVGAGAGAGAVGAGGAGVVSGQYYPAPAPPAAPQTQTQWQGQAQGQGQSVYQPPGYAPPPHTQQAQQQMPAPPAYMPAFPEKK